MTAPITGPYTKSDFLYDIPHWSTGQLVNQGYSLKRTWYRQAKPYDLPLQFDFIVKRGKTRYTSDGPYGHFFGSDDEIISTVPDYPEQPANIYNKAYAKFISEMGEAVELGTATAEGREAIGMLTHRLGQIGNFTRHLARGKLGLAASDLGIEWSGVSKKFVDKRLPPSLRPKKTYGRETARSFSSLYLEAHFGWSPLLKDIHDAVEVLNAPLRPYHVKVRAGGSWNDSKNSYVAPHRTTDWIESSGYTGQYNQTCTLAADIYIVNPNLATMQQYGILNPVSVAWELVPFSFVLDWFVNVGDFLGSLTDLAGVELKNATRTMFTRYTGNGFRNSVAVDPKSSNTSYYTSEVNTVHCFRRLGLGSGPSIRLRSPKAWGIRRGLAAASLLMQRFPRQVIDQNAISLAKKRTAFRANVFPQFYGKYY